MPCSAIQRSVEWLSVDQHLDEVGIGPVVGDPRHVVENADAG